MLKDIYSRTLISSLYFLTFLVATYNWISPYVDTVDKHILVLKIFLLFLGFSIPYKLLLYMFSIKQSNMEFMIILEVSFAWLLSGIILVGYGIFLGLVTLIVMSWAAWYHVKYVYYNHTSKKKMD